MEITYIIALVAIGRAIASAIRNRQPAINTLVSVKPESLCTSCVYAHLAQGYRERDKLIACTFGGTARPLKFAVSNCTLYCNRNAGTQVVRVIGFADIVGQSAGASVAAKSTN